MIPEPQNCNAHRLSAWAGGVALLFLGIGLHGAAFPLLPVVDAVGKRGLGEDTVMVENFQPPAAAAADATPEPDSKEIEEYLVIPPLPEITPPLTPPEMVEITPIEELREVPKPQLMEKKPEPPTPKPKPAPATRPTTKPTSNSSSTANGNGSAPTVFNGTGGGRFPSPSYPASARAAKAQGSVRLLVTVEASGIPSTVEVTSSSGSAALDGAARDTVQRRWRWPSGTVRKFIIPVRFTLQ